MTRQVLLQGEVADFYAAKDYDASPQTLMLGLMEEVGELAQAVLFTECVDFRPSQHKIDGELGDIEKHEDVAGEVADVIIYALALCNRLGIRPAWQKLGLKMADILLSEVAE